MTTRTRERFALLGLALVAAGCLYGAWGESENDRRIRAWQRAQGDRGRFVTDEWFGRLPPACDLRKGDGATFAYMPRVDCYFEPMMVLVVQ